jgi:tRNA threonylcarbamoyladenosine biosynthesis protein TsaB
VGQVALARGDTLLGVRRLDEARRHARDLVPAVAELLASQGWTASDLTGVIVSRGPGSYTGLRVGVMSAKTLAYATGCALVAIDTFAAIAAQSPPEAACVDVIADAQQDRLYLQRFGRSKEGAGMLPQGPLCIRPFVEWVGTLTPTVWVNGPGLAGREARMPGGIRLAPPSCWDPRPESLLQLGLERYLRGQHDDVWALEPLYLRPSSAEEQWQRRLNDQAGAAASD